MKSYTDIGQSKKLAEILPIESADMHWQYIEEDNGQLQWFCFPKDFSINQHNTVSAWSLAALFSVIPEGIIENYYVPNLQKENEKYSIAYGNEELLCEADNPVDVCFKMIIKLHEQKLL